MFRYFRLDPTNTGPADAQEEVSLSVRNLLRDPTTAAPLRHFNDLPRGLKERGLRVLVPPTLLTRFDISPINWQDHESVARVHVVAEPASSTLTVTAALGPDGADPFYTLELEDTSAHGIRLNWLAINNPHAPRFDVDINAQGESLLYGLLARNLAAEEAALRAGLGPAQVRKGLGASGEALAGLELFLIMLSHTAYMLEPLTYSSALIFERRGFAYVRGHAFMDEINREFQPGGRLHAALDGSSPFRQAALADSIRGRAWAIHDGILAAIDRTWDGLRMIKRLGRQAGVNTAPGVPF